MTYTITEMVMVCLFCLALWQYRPLTLSGVALVGAIIRAGEKAMAAVLARVVCGGRHPRFVMQRFGPAKLGRPRNGRVNIIEITMASGQRTRIVTRGWHVPDMTEVSNSVELHETLIMCAEIIADSHDRGSMVADVTTLVYHLPASLHVTPLDMCGLVLGSVVKDQAETCELRVNTLERVVSIGGDEEVKSDDFL